MCRVYNFQHKRNWVFFSPWIMHMDCRVIQKHTISKTYKWICRNILIVDTVKIDLWNLFFLKWIKWAYIYIYTSKILICKFGKDNYIILHKTENIFNIKTMWKISSYMYMHQTLFNEYVTCKLQSCENVRWD